MPELLSSCSETLRSTDLRGPARRDRNSPRCHVVKIRLSAEERQYLRMFCRRLGVDAGAWARDVLLSVSGAPYTRKS